MRIDPFGLLLLLALPAAGVPPDQTVWEKHFDQGEALEREGKYSAAAGQFEAARSEAETGGPVDFKLPLTLHNLGAVYRELGRYSDAERCYRNAIAIWQANQPSRALELASSLQNLGALNLVLGRPSAAEPLYRRAYELRLTSLGPSDPQIGVSLHGLAQVLHERRQYSEAADLYRRAAAILEAGLGRASLDLADLLHNWAILCRDMGSNGEARQLLDRAAAAYETAAPNHPKLAVIYRNLAELEAADGNPGRAGQLFTRSLRICDAVLPPDHPQTGLILQAYAKFLSATKRQKEARPVAERARAIMEKNTASGSAYTVAISTLAAK